MDANPGKVPVRWRSDRVQCFSSFLQQIKDQVQGARVLVLGATLRETCCLVAAAA